MSNTQMRHNFRYASAYTGNDTFSPTGAKRLADTIKEYWRKQGKAPNVEVQCENMGNLGSIFVVRSDMVNGLPRKVP